MKARCIVSKWQKKDGNTLTADDLIRVNSNKPEFGSLMLITPDVVVVTNGFANRRNKVGFITGSIEDLKAIISTYNLKEGTDYSEAVSPSFIRTVEITMSEFDQHKTREDHVEPAESGFREKINPQSGDVLCNSDGEVIYWKTEVVAAGGDLENKLIQHVSTGAIVTPDEKEFHVEDDKKVTAKTK